MSTEKSEGADGGEAMAERDAAGPRTEPISENAGEDPAPSEAPSEPRADGPDHEDPVVDPDPEPIPDAAPPEEEVHEEERGSSLAARALTFLVLLLVGAAAGIWAAPRIAPMLPSGLAPVAAWLTPGSADAEAQIATLQSRIETEVAALNDRLAAAPDPAAIEGRTQSLISAAEQGLSAQIAEVRDTLGASDISETSARVGRLETALDGAVAELASLKDQFASGAAAAPEAAASIDLYKAELDGLRAEVARLAGSVASLGTRLDSAEASAEARAAAAEAKAESVQQAAVAERDLSAAQADIALIRAALAGGQPFEEPLARLAAATGLTPPAGLSAAAATGVATPATLRSSFSDAAHAAIRSSIVAGAGEGLVARSRAFIEAQVASRSLTPQAGLTPDAVLSRMEDALRRDDLAAALAESEQLPSEAAAALSGWIAAARLRADADAGLSELSASISTMN